MKTPGSCHALFGVTSEKVPYEEIEENTFSIVKSILLDGSLSFLTSCHSFGVTKPKGIILVFL